MSDCIDDHIEGNFVFLAVLAGVAVRSAADPTNMAVTAAESGRAL